jgi:SAM-dependent methyltransferase
MHLDVHLLRDFYYRTRLGRAAQKALRDKLVLRWGTCPGLTVAGYGFAVPLLRPFLPWAKRVIGLMPAPQGVMHWPADGANHSLLCDESRWPLANASVDRLVMLHGMETSEHPLALLDEALRVLAPQGRLLVVVPSRSGMWARRDATPFGFGRPYSRSQLERQLHDAGFDPIGHGSALFFPPRDTPFWLRASRLMESLGQRYAIGRFGGVIMVEVTRAEPARPRSGLGSLVARPVRVLEGLPQAGTQPAWRGGQRP